MVPYLLALYLTGLLTLVGLIFISSLIGSKAI